MKLPKPDQRTLDGLARLKNQPDFQLFVKHQQAMYAYYTEMLVTAAPADVQSLQGKALQLRDFLDLVK